MKNKIIIWLVALFISVFLITCNRGDPPEAHLNVSIASYLHNNLDNAILAIAKFYPVCSDTTDALVTWTDSLIHIAPGEAEKIMDYSLAAQVELYWADDTTHIATHNCHNITSKYLYLVDTPSDFEDAVLISYSDYYDYYNFLSIKSDRYLLDSVDFNYYPINYYTDGCNNPYDSTIIERRKNDYELSCSSLGYAIINYYELNLSAECFKH